MPENNLTTSRQNIGVIAACFLLISLTGCRQPSATTETNYVQAAQTQPEVTEQTAPVSIPYDFSEPDERFELPDDLEEISGIAQLNDSLLVAIQDEDGDVYFLDFRDGQIVKKQKFAGKGDYEAIAVVGKRLFILRSDGILYTVDDWQAKEWDATKKKLSVPGGCDAEGLALDRNTGKLLVACKDKPGKGRRGSRAIFSYDVDNEVFNSSPGLIVLSELPRLQKPGTSKELDRNKFMPSDLAQQPGTDNWYVVSSVEEMMVVLNPDGKLLTAVPLPKDLFRQPEGLCFLTNGDLFIANEAAGKDATLLRYNLRTEGPEE